MRSPRSLIAGRRVATFVIGLTAFATAGVAAAAAGGASFPGFGASDHTKFDLAADASVPGVAGASVTASVQTDVTVAVPPAATEPTPTPAPTEPPTTQPPTTQPPHTLPALITKPDTFVPSGISLECTLEHHTVTCHWSGGVVDGFAKFLLLRSDGRVVFMSDSPTADGYIDPDVAAGSYSYVVVTVGSDNIALMHSNRVAVTIGAAG